MGGCIVTEYFLYLDSSKTTKSTQDYGPKPALEYLVIQRKHLMPIIKKYRGKVLSICWDSIMAVFNDPMDAVFAGEEIRECYNTNPDFLKCKEDSKIGLSGLAISSEMALCEELGENQVENGDFVIHGEKLINSIKSNLFLYGFELSDWHTDYFGKDQKFSIIQRGTAKEVKEWKNKIVLCYSHEEGKTEYEEIITKNKGYRPKWLSNFLWFFDDKADALNGAQQLYEKTGGKMTIAVHFGENSLVHENLQILSSYGINLACKLVEDVEKDSHSIRVTKAAFGDSPTKDFKDRKVEVGGVHVDYWEFKK
jgi:hypothetical protein